MLNNNYLAEFIPDLQRKGKGEGAKVYRKKIGITLTHNTGGQNGHNFKE